jgi:hypothetical protein
VVLREELDLSQYFEVYVSISQLYLEIKSKVRYFVFQRLNISVPQIFSSLRK